METIGGRRFFASRWSFSEPSDLAEDIALLRETHPNEQGPLWVLDGGFDVRLGDGLPGPAGAGQNFNRTLYIFPAPEMPE
jgi:hypothetical protein